MASFTREKMASFTNEKMEFCSLFFNPSNDSPEIIKEAIEFERITGNQVPEQISHPYGNTQVTPKHIVQKVMEYIPENTNSIVDVFNNGFASEIAINHPNKEVNCIVTSKAEEACINLRCGSEANVDIIFSDNVFKEDLSRAASDFVIADLSNNPIITENLLTDNQKKIKKYILQYNANVESGDVLMNTQYNIQYGELQAIEKMNRKNNNSHKVNSSSCGPIIGKIEADKKFKLSNYSLCGIALCMSLMSSSSTAAIIVNNSILTNKLVKSQNGIEDVRVALMTHFNLQKIIAIDSKRSLIIFSNNKDEADEESRVSFSELQCELWTEDTFYDDENGYVQIKYEKGSVKEVNETNEFELSSKVIREYGYMMNYAKCKHFNIDPADGYHLEEIGAIGKMCSGILKDEDGKATGKYDLYTKNGIKKTDINGFNDGKIIITDNEIIYRSDDFNCTKDCVVIESKEEYYLLFALLAFYPNNKKSISKTAIGSYRIPFPNEKDDTQEWIDQLWPLYQNTFIGSKVTKDKAIKLFDAELHKFKLSVAHTIN